jgi:hypothetical protein
MRSIPSHPFTIHIADDSIGYFVQPTIILTKDPKSITMVEEVFGPVLTVRKSCASIQGPAYSPLNRYTCMRIKTMSRHWT